MLHSDQTFLYSGGPKPVTNKTIPRIFGHNLDPRSTMARYALALQNIEFQEMAVDLESVA
jgi:hypothetical protein